jgi:hypothetical protein
MVRQSPVYLLKALLQVTHASLSLSLSSPPPPSPPQVRVYLLKAFQVTPPASLYIFISLYLQTSLYLYISLYLFIGHSQGPPGHAGQRPLPAPPPRQQARQHHRHERGQVCHSVRLRARARSRAWLPAWPPACIHEGKGRGGARAQSQSSPFVSWSVSAQGIPCARPMRSPPAPASRTLRSPLRRARSPGLVPARMQMGRGVDWVVVCEGVRVRGKSWHSVIA